jgi:hypothetical protein
MAQQSSGWATGAELQGALLCTSIVKIMPALATATKESCALHNLYDVPAGAAGPMHCQQNASQGSAHQAHVAECGCRGIAELCVAIMLMCPCWPHLHLLRLLVLARLMGMVMASLHTVQASETETF